MHVCAYAVKPADTPVTTWATAFFFLTGAAAAAASTAAAKQAAAMTAVTGVSTSSLLCTWVIPIHNVIPRILATEQLLIAGVQQQTEAAKRAGVPQQFSRNSHDIAEQTW